jgi:solute carrier family 25 oxoglutarate transporter 11
MFATARNVVKAEGVGGIYSGVSAAVLRSVLFIGTKFAAYDVLKERMAAVGDDRRRTSSPFPSSSSSAPPPSSSPFFSSSSPSPSSPLPPPSNAELPLYAKVVCGLGAGLIGAVVGNPADLAMVRMQADGRIPKDSPLRRNYRNGGQALVHIARSEGIATLWRGCAPTTTRAMIVTASQLAIYDQTKQEIKARVPGGMEEGLTLHTASSLVAGSVASMTSNPFDVAKTRMMNMQPGQYQGLGHCLAVTVRKEGATALYKGLSATMLRQVPLNVVRFSLMEQFKRLLKV